MRQFFILSLTFVFASLTYAQTSTKTDKPLQVGHIEYRALSTSSQAIITDIKTQNAINSWRDSTFLVLKGNMPPLWLQNKVTPAQFDTLVVLNRLCNVDYSAFKGYGLPASIVSLYMNSAKRWIQNVMKDSVNVTPNVGWGLYETQILKPLKDNTVKGVRKVEYVIYSSVDGYDVHMLLMAEMKLNKRSGNYESVTFQIAPYTLARIPITIGKTELLEGESQKVSQIVIPKDSRSATYSLNGYVFFIDPLGDKHRENINSFFKLKLDK